MLKADVKISLGGEEIWTGQVLMNMVMGLVELNGMNKEVDVSDNTTVNEK